MVGHIKDRLQTRECGTSKIDPVSDFFGALVICDEHRAEVLEFVNFLQTLIIKHDGSVLLLISCVSGPW